MVPVADKRRVCAHQHRQVCNGAQGCGGGGDTGGDGGDHADGGDGVLVVTSWLLMHAALLPSLMHRSMMLSSSTYASEPE